MTFAIRNWAKFQHYTKRHPPWIKLYHDLLDDDDFAALDHFTQLLYFKLLMAASRKDNRIPEDPTWMATELSLPRARVQRGLAALLEAGFLASASASARASNGASSLASASASKSASPTRAPARSRESEAEPEIDISKAVALDVGDSEPSMEPPIDTEADEPTAQDFNFINTPDLLREMPL